jgi:hypothetical protein
MGNKETDKVIEVFSFVFVMAIHVITWRMTYASLNEHVESSYNSSQKTVDVTTYYQNVFWLKKTDIPRPPFSPLNIIVYIFFAYFGVIFIVFLFHCFLYLFIRFILYNCIYVKPPDSNDEDDPNTENIDNAMNALDPSKNFVMVMIKDYILSKFIHIIESVILSISIIIIISIVISVFFKPILLVKKNAQTIVDIVMWLFLGLIPYMSVVNFIVASVKPTARGNSS